MKTRRNSRNVHILTAPLKQRKVTYLLLSDVHWDNPHCNRGLLKRHLDEAKEKNRKVFINGDLFCFMQGKYDPRRTKSDIRAEHNVNNYVDEVINTAAEWFRPYAEQIEVVGYGNHETSILRNLETDPIERFVERLNTIANPQDKVHAGGYGGWIVTRFELSEMGNRPNYRIKYHHGYGGGGPVTKGVIQHSREAVKIQGADAVWMGHVHEDYEMTYFCETLDQNFNIKHKEVTMLRTASYKEEYEDGFGGFHVERGRPVKPLGGRWLDLYVQKEDGSQKIKAYSYKTKN